VSTISFNQANMQHSIVASRVLSRTVGVKGSNTGTVVPQGLYYGPQYSRIYRSSRVEQIDHELVSLRGMR
jgi:hypothetical protein